MRRRSRFRLLSRAGVATRVTTVSIAATLLSVCPPAAAQTDRAPNDTAPDETSTAKARELFNEGTERARRGDWSQALVAFERSAALRPHPVTTYNIGYCERALGRYTRARKRLGEALAENAAHGGVELPQDLATAAKGYLAELERRIARAVISLPGSGVAVSVDGRPLERAVMDGPRPVLWACTRDLGPAEVAPASTFELELDPGTHVFVVSKPGYPEGVTTRSFEAGPETDVVLTLSTPAPQPMAEGAPRQHGGESEARAAAPSRLPLYIGLGVAGAGLATGVVSGAIAIGIKDEGVSHYPQAYTPADVSTAGFIVGGAGAAFGALYWWLSLRGAAGASAPAAPGPVAVAPWIAPRGVGITGAF